MDVPRKFSPLTLEQIRFSHQEFAKKRNWEKFHQPRNILLAMIAEVGELSECFQWKPDHECTGDAITANWSQKERTGLADEISDVIIYLIRLADRCQIDLAQVTIDRLGFESSAEN